MSTERQELIEANTTACWRSDTEDGTSEREMIETRSIAGAPTIAHAYGLYITAPTEGITNDVLRIQGNGRPILTIASDATVTLGEGVDLDEASAAFWENVRFMGKTLMEQVAERDATIAALRGGGR